MSDGFHMKKKQSKKIPAEMIGISFHIKLAFYTRSYENNLESGKCVTDDEKEFLYSHPVRENVQLIACTLLQHKIHFIQCNYHSIYTGS